MGSLWLKIKVGTKIAIFAILSIAALVFILQNLNKPVKIWLWNEYETTLLKVLFFAVMVSVIFTILIGTLFRTLRQIREIRTRSRAEQLEQEIKDMKEKAAMLQTRPRAGLTTPAVSPPAATPAPAPTSSADVAYGAPDERAEP